MFVSAVSNSNTMNSKTNLRNASNIAFKGGLATLVRDEVKLSGRASKVVDEAAGTLARKVRGITNRNELPVVSKPVVAGISDEVQMLADAVVDGVPIAGSAYRIKKAADAIKKGDGVELAVQAANFGTTVIKQGVALKAGAVGMAVAGPPGAAIGYVGAIVVQNKVVRRVVKAWLG